MTIETWALIILAITFIITITCIPLAIVAIRQDRKLKRERWLAGVAAAALEIAREVTDTGEMRAITEPFIENQVSLSSFGDHRRRSSHTTEFLKPETGPIPLPNAHVPVQ